MNFGPVEIGKIPRVVGTVCSAEFLSGLASEPSKISADIVEVRLDRFSQTNAWPAACERLEKSGTPVLLTLRLASEGGNWRESDSDRAPIFSAALDLVSAVDVEFRSAIARRVAAEARAKGKACLISFHDFERTPDFGELRATIGAAQAFGSAVKISTLIAREPDLEILARLLQEPWRVPLCVIGMGAKGTAARFQFPAAGSALAYGYLDQPVAPGQISAAEIQDQLRRRLLE